ncbi:MAG: peptidyl-prolyl cis-trans isomerase [Chloroflexota bacterium]|jgi:parvulin-like peptidyl-prolyl isomerase|nr:peptidyl-prolyl cis-trans isomerase [Chloroflexota bacterium]
MTLRSKPAEKRSYRSGRDSHDRHNLYVNLAFGLVIFIGVLTLVAAAAATYIDQHFGEVASVNGQKISKDAYRDRGLVDAFRIDQAEAQLRDQLQLGRITQAEHDSRTQVLEQQRQGLSNSTLERLIDTALQGQLASARGITVDDAQIDGRLVTEATTKEQRHIATITVEPEVTTGATDPTEAQKTAAKAKADKALADITGGKTFEEVAKAVSSDSSAASGGDAGWVAADDSALDPTFLTAVFAAPQGGTTAVVAGADGSYRIGRVLEIGTATVDSTWTDKIKAAGIPLGSYRDAVRGDIVRDALEKAVLAEVTDQPTTQRLVSDIFISTGSYQGPGDEVRVRHILYTPGDAAPGAASPLPSTDPAWASAKTKAQATYATLKALVGKPDELTAKFAEIAKKDSLDTGSGADGGELGYFTQGSLDKGFGDAIFKAGLKKGDLLEPVASQYGWHVILFEDRRPAPEDRMKAIKAQADAPGADFAKLAKDNSETAEAAKGGDLGWIARNQLDAAQETAIFAAPIGKPSDVVTTDNGLYIYLVREEQSRKPDATQLEALKANAFQNWYDAEKLKADITPDLTAPTS